MAFNQPPNTPPGPQQGAAPAPPPPAPPASRTLAETSAMGTTSGAPTMQIQRGPPPGSGLPGSGPPPATPGNAPPPPPAPSAPTSAMPPPARPVVAPHGMQRSVGTHLSRSPNKRNNAAHGMTQAQPPNPQGNPPQGASNA